MALGWNLETGACVTAAFVAFLVLRTSGRSSGLDLLRAGLLFACGLAAAFLLLAIIVRIGLGYWPDPVAVLESFPLVGQFAGGYGGLKLTQIDPLACLIFAHALFVVVYGIVRWQQEDLDGRSACRIALATLAVLWSAYYFKGPHFWNVWSLLFLYGFLLGDLLPCAAHISDALSDAEGADLIRRRGARAHRPARDLVPQHARRALGTRRPSGVGEGARLPGDDGVGHMPVATSRATPWRARRARSSRLLGAHDGAVYLTSNSYFMPLMTGVLPPLQQRDAFELTVSHADFDALVAQLARLNPPCLLFDAPDTVFPGSALHRRFYERLRSALPAYDKQGSAPAWDVRCR